MDLNSTPSGTSTDLDMTPLGSGTILHTSHTSSNTRLVHTYREGKGGGHRSAKLLNYFLANIEESDYVLNIWAS